MAVAKRRTCKVQPIVGHFRHLDLFSGIGGFALAAEAAGWNTVGFAEVDDYASRVLKRHWPDVPNYGDVRNVPAMPVDLVTGGFPCQPFSLAGKRAGTADDRYLWPEMLAVVRRCRPAWVLGENVPGIIGMGLDSCLSDLEGYGYTCQAFCIPACAVGAGHRRQRIWIVAHTERDSVQGGASESEERLDECGKEQLARLLQSCARPSLSSARAYGKDYGVWQRVDGVQRNKSCGNAIVPQVAYPLLRWMRAGLCTANAENQALTRERQ